MRTDIKQAVVLCGGLGSRLGDLTRETPKPLLSVDGVPFLQILMQEITRFGVDRFLLLAAFRSEQIEAFSRGVAAAIGRKIEVEVAVEPDRAGTGGALFHARHLLDETFLLFNGDSMLDTSLPKLGQLLAEEGRLGALALRHLPQAGRYGVVELEGDRITTFGARRDASAPAWINGGIYALRREVVDQLQPQGSLEQDILPRLAQEGRLAGLRCDGFFLDIGVPEDFARAQLAIPAHRLRPALFLDRDGVLNVNHGHVGSIARFEWIEGAREAVARANALGYYVFVVTNQAGIAKGYYSEADYQALSRHMRSELAAVGGWIDDERYCPFHVDAVTDEFRADSDWRKPRSGMLLDLLSHWPVDLSRSVMVGDSDTDVAAAEGAGVRGLLFTGGRLDRFLDPVLDMGAK